MSNQEDPDTGINKVLRATTNTTEAPFETNPVHSGVINPLVRNKYPEHQAVKEINVTETGTHYTDEWIGTTSYIEDLLNSLLPNSPNTATATQGENITFRITRGNGDLSKLTRSYDIPFWSDTWEQTGKGSTISENSGVTPWQVQTETTDIDPVNYYILHTLNLSESDANKISRQYLAEWDATDTEHKVQYLVKTIKGEYRSLDPSSTKFKPLKDTTIHTYNVAKLIAKEGRNTFPLSVPKIIHNKLTNGKYRKEWIRTGKNTSYWLQPQDDDYVGSDIVFPDYFGVLLDHIPDLDESFKDFGLSAHNKFYLNDYSLQNYDGRSRYLVTYTYTAWPKRLPNPWPSVQPEKTDNKETKK